MYVETPRHRVFISYYHADDQWYKDELLRQNRQYSIFTDWSVQENEIDDTGLTSESIRQIIRDDYIKDATVLILLCGQNSKTRKHIDWELHAAMFNTQNNPNLGILVVNLPGISQACRASGDDEKNIVSPGGGWISLSTRKEYEERYPYVPVRNIDCFVAGMDDNSIVPISVADWEKVSNNPISLKKLVHFAYERGHAREKRYIDSRVMKERNS